MAVPTDDPDGGVACVPEPQDDGGGGDGPRNDGGPDARGDARPDGPGPFCGDFSCNGTETCETCPQDCGSCAPFCGDNLCNGNETCATCSTDCGACPPDAAPPDGPPNCPPAITYTSPVVASTTGLTSCSTPSCGSSTTPAPDLTYRFTPTTSGSCHASTIGASTTFDTIVSVRTSPTGADVICNDDHGMTGMTPATASYVIWNAVAFTSYYIVVDGYNGASGTFQLTISCP